MIPVVNYKDDSGQDILKVEKAIEHKIDDNETIEQATQRITQSLAYEMEKWLMSFPEQIHYWEDIASTFYAPKDRKVHINAIY